MGSWLLLSPDFLLLSPEADARCPIPEELGDGALTQASPSPPYSTPVSVWQFVYLKVWLSDSDIALPPKVEIENVVAEVFSFLTSQACQDIHM